MEHFQRLYRRYLCLTGEGRGINFLKSEWRFAGAQMRYADCINGHDEEAKLIYFIHPEVITVVVCAPNSVKNSIFLLIILSSGPIDYALLTSLHYSDKLVLHFVVIIHVSARREDIIMFVLS